MNRTAVFVDAGYLFAQSSVELIGQKSPRSSLVLDAVAVRDFFRELARAVAPESGLLRIYWYDGTSSGPTPQHLALMYLDDMKVRLGFVNSVGEQKGVDSLIVTDMIELARNRAIADALLLSGDEDLRVGVQQAQEFGVRVHIVGIRPARGSQSQFLLAEADTTRELKAPDLLRFLRVAQPTTERPVHSEVAASGDPATHEFSEVAHHVAGQILDEKERSTLVELYRAERRIPQQVDRVLLARARKANHGQDLDNQQKNVLRRLFIEGLENRPSPSNDPAEASAP